ncbi:hypothetical protein [Phreatobacter stygius]|uniref:Uncharacterized protein n=1 Tax=Phreatobacter stygius TaxID=1940610 RepID=A0A4D7AUL8_9HYPH|nr:hypothetical protein [Phreatobacter stygius]QCI63361.1 hypothetical protein E8M01_03380 [Phreatobacter stygius]
MKSLAAAFGLLTLWLAAPALGQTQGLPRQAEIAEDYATYLCPTEAAARQMLVDYLKHNRMEAGYRATGCRARLEPTGPIRIVQVVERHAIDEFGKPTTYMLYRGTTRDGQAVTGLVNEQGNNQHPRTPFARWLAVNAPNGALTIAARDRRGHVCPDPAAAMKVVAAIAEAKRRSAPVARQQAALTAALRTNGCSAASGAYRVTALHRNEGIDVGFEADEDWTALSATDPRDRTVGLVYDASVYR